MHRSGARSIVPQDMIWRSARLFWIVRRCHHPKRRRSCVKVTTVELILTTRTRWMRSI
jgi:hypothetical protein